MPEREAAWADFTLFCPSAEGTGPGLLCHCRLWGRLGPRGALARPPGTESTCCGSAPSGPGRGHRRALFSNKQVRGLLFLSITPNFFPAEQLGRGSHMLSIFIGLKIAPLGLFKTYRSLHCPNLQPLDSGSSSPFALPLAHLQPGRIPGKVEAGAHGCGGAGRGEGAALPPLQGRWRSPPLPAQWLWLLGLLCWGWGVALQSPES